VPDHLHFVTAMGARQSQYNGGLAEAVGWFIPEFTASAASTSASGSSIPLFFTLITLGIYSAGPGEEAPLLLRQHARGGATFDISRAEGGAQGPDRGRWSLSSRTALLGELFPTSATCSGGSSVVHAAVAAVRALEFQRPPRGLISPPRPGGGPPLPRFFSICRRHGEGGGA